MNGLVVSVLSLALCMIACGIGSAIGLYNAGSAAAAVIAEDDKKFSKVFVLAVLPATQGIYGFVIAIIGLGSIDAAMTLSQGLSLLGATLPMTIVGAVSAILQGATSVSGILAIAKNDNAGVKMMLFPAMVETYAILSLVITIMLLGAI